MGFLPPTSLVEFSLLAGFALAKYEFKGKGAVMVLMLATMILPSSVTMAPLYDLLFKLHMVDKVRWPSRERLATKMADA